MAHIAGRKVGVLATDGVEQVELTEPVKALKAAKAEVVVVAPDDVVAVIANRSAQRRRNLERQDDDSRRKAGHLSKTGRSARFLP